VERHSFSDWLVIMICSVVITCITVLSSDKQLLGFHFGSLYTNMYVIANKK